MHLELKISTITLLMILLKTLSSMTFKLRTLLKKNLQRTLKEVLMKSLMKKANQMKQLQDLKTMFQGKMILVIKELLKHLSRVD